MPENRYAMAGWLSIVGAVLFVASFVVGIIEAVIAGKAFGYHGPVVGPALPPGVADGSGQLCDSGSDPYQGRRERRFCLIGLPV